MSDADNPAGMSRPEDLHPGLRCPRCKSAWSKTENTIRLPRGAVRRYRRCMHCRRRFTTLEVPQGEVR